MIKLFNRIEMPNFCWFPASHICLLHSSTFSLLSWFLFFFSRAAAQWRAVMSWATSGQLVWRCDLSSSPLLVQTKKNTKSHKSIKGNNSKQQQGSQGNDTGLLLLTCTRMLFFPPLSKTHFHTCHQSTELCLLLHWQRRIKTDAWSNTSFSVATMQGQDSKCSSAFTQPRLQCRQPWLRSWGLAVTHHLMSKAHCRSLPGDNLLLA